MINVNIGGKSKLLTTRRLLTSINGSDLQKSFSGNYNVKQIIPQNEKQAIRMGADDISLERIKESEIIEVFVDRNSQQFELMINFLRNDLKIYPEFSSIKDEIYFANELEYWKIPNRFFDEKKLIS